MSAGRRHALPPGVRLQGAEGAERAVELQGGQVPKQEPGLREGMVQKSPGRGERVVKQLTVGKSRRKGCLQNIHWQRKLQAQINTIIIYT